MCGRTSDVPMCNSQRVSLMCWISRISINIRGKTNIVNYLVRIAENYIYLVSDSTLYVRTQIHNKDKNATSIRDHTKKQHKQIIVINCNIITS